MTPRSFVAALLRLVVMWVAASLPAGAQGPAAPPPSAAATARLAGAHLQRPGLPRLGVVASHIYRGGQPDAQGFGELQALGVDLVVNFRHEPVEIARERALVEARGLRYVSIPWRGKEDPKPRQVSEFLDLLRANPDRTVFAHCERGAERTGVMIACYRMSTEGWTPEQALREMTAFGFRRFGFGHLKRFVREFPTLLMRDPLFRRPVW